MSEKLMNHDKLTREQYDKINEILGGRKFVLIHFLDKKKANLTTNMLLERVAKVLAKANKLTSGTRIRELKKVEFDGEEEYL